MVGNLRTTDSDNIPLRVTRKGMRTLPTPGYLYPYPQKPAPSTKGKGFDGCGYSMGSEKIPGGYLTTPMVVARWQQPGLHHFVEHVLSYLQ